MGRLEDIVERNRNPKTSFRKARRAAAPPAPAPATTQVNQAEQGETKGRLDRILERNRHPNTKFRWLKVGLAGMVLFVVLILLIFTDLAAPPEAAYPERVQPRPAGVDGVKLWRAPKRPAGSATH